MVLISESTYHFVFL